MTLNKSKNEFIQNLSEVSGLEQQEIVSILKDKYGNFNPAKKSEYYAYIMNIAGERAEKIEEVKEDALALNKCPLCGARIFGTGEYNKYTKEPKWQCSEDKNHFLRWRTNQILERKGLKPLSEKEWNDVNRSN